MLTNRIVVKSNSPIRSNCEEVEWEPDHPEVVAYLFGDNNGVYILTVDNQIIKLDLDEFNYDQFKVFDVMGNLFYHMISIQKDGYEKLYVFDRNYKLLDKYGCIPTCMKNRQREWLKVFSSRL